MAKVKKIRNFATSKLAQPVIYYFIRGYSKLFRLQVENEETWLNYYLNDGGKVLLCVFHQQFFSAIHHFKNYEPYKPGLMISQSQDGDIIAGVAKKSGWFPVRGSSSRGGKTALKAMIDHLKENRLSAHIVDGPRGPAETVKAGLISMAESADAVVVPFYVSADKAWYFKSWDKFFIPKPFSKVILRFGDMIRLSDIGSPDEFEEKRVYIENLMKKENERLKSCFH